MSNPTDRLCLVASALLAALWLQGCKDDKPAAEAEQTEGGEADNPIDEAHQDFKREVDPAADVVDEKTKAVIKEGKRAVKKTGDAIAGDDEAEDEPAPAPEPSK